MTGLLPSAWRGSVLSRFRTRILIVILTGALLGLATALAISYRIESSAHEQSLKTLRLLALLDESRSIALASETGQRGFLLTRERPYLAPYLESRDRWIAVLGELETAVSDQFTPAQQLQIRRMRELSESKLKELDETVRMVEAGQYGDAVATVRSGRGLEVMEQYRDIVANLERALESDLRQAIVFAERVELWTLIWMVSSGVLAMVLLLVGFRLERRSALAEVAELENERLRVAQEESELLARELNHRVKNLFAVIMSIVSLSGRREQDVPTAMTKLRGRIQALASAHMISQGQHDLKDADLRQVVQAILAPYVGREDRLAVDGPPLALPAKLLTPIGLILHELATNASKYGALAAEEGRICLNWTVEEAEDGKAVVLTWQESGGPAVLEPDNEGFGSLMIRQACAQLGGQLDLSWEDSGLKCVMGFSILDQAR